MKYMGESAEQVVGPAASMAGRRVDFGTPGKAEGLGWGIEVDLDITDTLARYRIEGSCFKLPPHIKKITFLDLAPQEALPPNQRTIRSTIRPHSFRGHSELTMVAAPTNPGNPRLVKLRRDFNLLESQDERRYKELGTMISWIFGPSDKAKKRFSNVLKQSSGDTLVIVHGHSSDMGGLGEQYPDEIHDKSGGIVQRMYNFVSMDAILNRYNDPEKFSAIVLNGCNSEMGSVKAKEVPVFYPKGIVKGSANPQFFWSKVGGVSFPE